MSTTYLTCGYAGGPSGAGAAIQVAVVNGVVSVSGPPVSVTLTTPYYPVDLGGVLGSRPRFDGQPLPYVLRPGTTITVPKAEAAALLAASAATGA